MRILGSASASRTTIASVGALYVLMVTLTVLLIDSLLSRPFDLDSGMLIALLSIGLLLPLGLMVLVGTSVARLIRDKRQRLPGSGLKSRLAGFFGLVVFLSTVPQAIVSVSFLATGLNVALRTQTGQAISQGLSASLDFYDREVERLRVLALDGTLQRLVDGYSRETPDLSQAAEISAEGATVTGSADSAGPGSNGGALWLGLLRRVPDAVAVQIIDARAQTQYFAGRTAFLSRAERAPQGLRDALGSIEPAVAGLSIDGSGFLQLTAPVFFEPGLPDAGSVPGATNDAHDAHGATNAPVRSAAPAEASPVAGRGSSAAQIADARQASRRPEHLAIITAEVPASLRGTSRLLTEAVRFYDAFEALRPRLFGILAILYGLFAGPIILLSIMASFFLSDRIMRPIRSLEDATRKVAEGDYAVRILARPGDDLGILMGSFNRMVAELSRARQRMAQAEKVQAWQEIARRLAHEVKNPLTPIRLAAERLQRKFETKASDFPEVLDRTVTTIVGEVDALTRMLNEFRSFSRLPAARFGAVSLRSVLEEAGGVYLDSPDVTISVEDVSPDISIVADTGQLRQVFTNLFTNSVEAADGRVHITVSARLVRHAEKTACRIRLADNGPGIPEEMRSSLFEPYATSKSHGTGLGLAIVERIVFDHQGRIYAEPSPSSGAAFVIEFPAESGS